MSFNTVDKKYLINKMTMTDLINRIFQNFWFNTLNGFNVIANKTE